MRQLVGLEFGRDEVAYFFDLRAIFAGLSDAERRRLIDHMFVPESERTKAARHLQEVDLDYRKSALSCHGPGEFDGGPHPGAQAPDATPILANGAETSLYRFLGRVNHQLLLFAGEGRGASTEELEAARREAAPYADWMDACVVTRHEWPELASIPTVTRIEDPKGAMHERYAAHEPSLYLLRPDGYVAYRSRGLAGVRAYLDGVP